VVALETACWFESSLGHKKAQHFVGLFYFNNSKPDFILQYGKLQQ
jgi:hypothetical protein